MKKFWLVWGFAWMPLWAGAWGQEGHSIVAELAQRQLTAQTQQAVQALLGQGVSLASASSWADTVAHADRPETAPWHFVDIPLAQSDYDAARDCTYKGKADNCVVAAIASNAVQLADATNPQPQRVASLKFLLHLVADVHQPMHTVAEGAGENALAVRFPFDPTLRRSGSTNLHAVWDSGLFHASYWSWGEHVDALQATWFADGKTLPPDACASKPSLKAQTICWALEAHAVAQRPGTIVAPGTELGADYLNLVKDARDLQLVRASVRLAAMLNQLLGH